MFTIEFMDPTDAWLTGLTSAVNAVVPAGIPLTEAGFRERYQQGWSDMDFNLNLGREQAHGIWHIVGYRMGVYLVMLTEWDITLVNSDEAIAEIWSSIALDDPEIVAATVADPLARELGIDIVMLGPAESVFFKRYAR